MVIARATTAQIQAGKMQELIDLYNTSIVPALKTLKGFQGAYLMTEGGDNKALSITVWESEADLVGATGTLQEALAKSRDLFAGSADTTNYELSVEVSA